MHFVNTTFFFFVIALPLEKVISNTALLTLMEEKLFIYTVRSMME